MLRIPLIDDSYFQNPGVKLTHDSEGRLTSMNTNAPRRTQSQLADFNCKHVPVASDPNLPPLEQLDANMRGLVEKLREIMDNRPICTRRVLANLVASEALSDIRYAIQYVGYIFKAGPWRDAVTKFGIDPRSDPKYREYQTMFFKIVLRDETKVWNDGRTKYNRSLQEKGEPSNKQSHVFDGTKVTADGKIWQMCDITDPLLRQILDDPSALRQTCEVSYASPCIIRVFIDSPAVKIRRLVPERCLGQDSGHYARQDCNYHVWNCSKW